MNKIIKAITLAMLVSTAPQIANAITSPDSTKQNNTAKERSYRNPPESKTLEDFFNPDSLPVGVGYKDITINGILYESIGIWFKNYGKKGEKTPVIQVTAEKHIAQGNDTLIVNYNIYDENADGNPELAGHSSRYQGRIGYIDNSLSKLRNRRDNGSDVCPTEEEISIFDYAFNDILKR